MALLAEPRWTLAAQALVEGCIDLQNDEDRVALLTTVCERLGDDLEGAPGDLAPSAGKAVVCESLVRSSVGRLIWVKWRPSGSLPWIPTDERSKIWCARLHKNCGHGLSVTFKGNSMMVPGLWR